LSFPLSKSRSEDFFFFVSLFCARTAPPPPFLWSNSRCRTRSKERSTSIFSNLSRSFSSRLFYSLVFAVAPLRRCAAVGLFFFFSFPDHGLPVRLVLQILSPFLLSPLDPRGGCNNLPPLRGLPVFHFPLFPLLCMSRGDPEAFYCEDCELLFFPLL